jgi:Fic family protein
MRTKIYNSWTPGHSGPLAKLDSWFKRLETMKAALDQARPLPPETVKSLEKDIALRYTFHSNAIEGNTLTLMETKVIIEDGLTVGGKSMREHLEAINHRDAIQFISNAARDIVPLDERTLKGIHSLVLRGIDPDNAGRWRDKNVIISGAGHTPPEAWHLPERMKEFFEWCASDAESLSPIERAARVHADFVNIHPFIDGNGRTARLLMNLELVKAGYPLAIVPADQRQSYYESLDRIAVTGDYVPFIEQICSFVEQGFEVYSRVLDGLV